MVTNGYLFDKKTCEFFKQFPLNYIQITIDGLEETHNINRIHKSGIPTFKTIIDNIDIIVNELPNTYVGVRMNIHNGNKNQYHLLYKQLKSRWAGKNCGIYPAFVLPQGENCSVSCLNPSQKAKFYIDLYENYNIKDLDFMPSSKIGSCSAIYENHYIIDPSGVLYKCWADLNYKERAIGDLISGIQKWDFIGEYTVGSDKFTDTKCLKCNIFPICDGGCNRFRVDHKLYDKNYNVCPVDREGLEKYLDILYEQSLIQ